MQPAPLYAQRCGAMATGNDAGGAHSATVKRYSISPLVVLIWHGICDAIADVVPRVTIPGCHTRWQLGCLLGVHTP